LLATLCKKTAPNVKIFSAKKLPRLGETICKFEMGYEKHLKEILLNYSYSILIWTHKGNILLLFAYKLQDNAKDWNENKNLLGINPNWNFITPDEL
jgi:hypothetical protein